MSAIDEAALEAAARAIHDRHEPLRHWVKTLRNEPRPFEDSGIQDVNRQDARAAIEAYLTATSSAADAKIARLEEALRPFADEANTYDCDDDEDGAPEIADARRLRLEEADGTLSESIITVGDFRRARAALGSDAV